ncbi:Inner membrane ABC transporter permease protein YdcV [Pseudovibrio sp. Ad13]|uniref:ABC transporter permease n=1 Tax=Pseudovibrio sp. Ad13 TaxID=989396 RepID=UPI0007AE4DC7|nr:ABC transporter permease [Pseudovibrio sp. Ad13]KZK79041.1 Inner membrane ABC transporter permease protein YdcV [Pseudovibrio sp. Ad13]
MHLSQATRITLMVLCAGALAFLYAPIMANFVFSLTTDRFPTLPISGFSTQWYELAFGDDLVIRALLNTALVALIVAPLSTFLGFTAAYTDYRFNFVGKKLLMVFALLPPLVPLVVSGLAMLAYLSRVGLSGNLSAIVISQIVLVSPFAMAIIRLRLSQIDDDLEFAAQNLGASNWRAFWEVIIPLTKTSVFAAFLLSFAVSFDEYAVTWFVGGLNETASVRVLSFLQSAVSPRINAIGSFTFVVSMSLILCAQFITLRRFSKEKL